MMARKGRRREQESEKWREFVSKQERKKDEMQKKAKRKEPISVMQEIQKHIAHHERVCILNLHPPISPLEEHRG